MPKLSVIVPVYNTAEYLNLCVSSILSQSFRDFELICVDNRSTDGSSDILRDYAAKDSRVTLIKTAKHGKPPASRQAGLEIAKGEFIIYVDSDDSIKPGMYECLIQEQEKYDADIVVCNFDMVYSDKVIHSYSNMKDELINLKEPGYPRYFKKYFCMQKPNNFLWSRIIRRSIAVDNNITFPDVDISEDTIFTMLCTARAEVVVHKSQSFYNYFQRENSSTRETIRSRNIADSYVHAFECVEDYVKSHGLTEMFREILPQYAATRVRSILFYINQATGDDSKTFDNLKAALKGSEMAKYLEKAIAENQVEDAELADTIHRALEELNL